MNSQNINLPKHWQIKKLGEICTYSKGKKPLVLVAKKTRDNPIPYINIKAFEKGIFDEYTNGEKCNLCDDGDLLMVWDGARCGFVGKAKNGAVGSTLMKIEPKEPLNKEYLYYFLLSKFHVLNTKPKGVGIPHIEPTLLWNFKFVLPPLPEQQAIVAKVEELLGDLENGKQQLLTAQQQLEVYRQSLLKAAFEGKLTNKDVKDGELPKGWKWDKLGKYAFVTKLAGFEFTKYVKYKELGEIPVIRAQNVSKKGFVERNFVYVDRELVEKLPRSRIYGSEILMVFVGAGLGNVGIVPLNKEYFLGPNVAKIALNNNYYNKFIYYFLSSTLGFGKITEKSKATAQGSISMSNIREVIVPIISLTEQYSIVQVLESKFSACDKIEETITQSLQQAEMLKQSILKRAFEGKLVTQVKEKAYEPSNVYFYQMQILGFIVRVSKEKKIQHGEMTVAKYTYFMDKVYGVPTYYNFERWHLGPFPPAMKKAINNKSYFVKEGNHIEVINDKKLFKYANPYKQQVQDAVNDLANIFSKYLDKERSHKTELLATVCKVLEDIQTTNLNDVRQSMQEWKIDLENSRFNNKAEKFSENETDKCLQFIMEIGWDKKLIKQNEF